jgi:hypothetical protein
MVMANLRIKFGVQDPPELLYCLQPEPKPCQFILTGIIWGLWITGFANYSPDLWGQPRQVSAACCVSRRGFSPPEGYM